MKLKRNAIILLILGAFMLFLGFIAPIVYWTHYTSQNGAIGIIGATEAPTYTFLLSASFDGLPLVFILLGISLVVSAGFCLIFSNAVLKYCGTGTSVISLGVSGVSALGLVCAFSWFSIGETSNHPIACLISAILGMICLFAFVALIAIYLKVRKTNWFKKGLCIDILTSILYLPGFFSVFSYVYESLF